ncbi:MAG: hypothetical protein ACLGHW_01620, partial [Gammaproteobacteria bacterium]
LPARALARAQALGVTERQLHRSSSPAGCAIVAGIGGVVQTFPKLSRSASQVLPLFALFAIAGK